jgi:hypothetical protein
VSTVEKFTAASLQALDVSEQLRQIAETLDAKASQLRRIGELQIAHPVDEDGIVLPAAVINHMPLARHADNLSAIALLVDGHAGAWNREGRALAAAAPKDSETER